MIKIGVIIQARKGSTRLPEKVVKPFYKEEGILEVIIKKLKEKNKYYLVLATTESSNDDQLVHIAQKNKIGFFRGSEQDVLKRFIDCADAYKLDVIIRICADNPFIDPEYIDCLIEEYKKEPKNYISFGMPDGTPTIKTHYGIFSELVELKALKSASDLTKDNLYREHVTNFIYSNSDLFKIKLLPVPEFLLNQKIRLTLDTKADFDILSALYKDCMLRFGNVEIQNVVSVIDQNKEMKDKMKKEIEKNTK